jgi:actin-related protein 4
MISNREAGYTTQSKFAAWIGGSIFGSMETYRDVRITKQEWEENADNVIETKSY